MTLWTTCKCASWSPPKLTSSLQFKHFMSSFMENLSSTMVVGEGELGVAVALGEQYILLLHVLMESLLAV